MNKDIPAISVVMPTYNDGEYLHDAIDSILNQTFTDFEFIIINDGSTDNTDAIISSYTDPRIKYLKNAVNLGNAKTRNIGMEAAKGKYIAIMDSDDISVQERFAVQYQYLEKHPETGILGGSKIFFDPYSWHYRFYPTDQDYIKSFLFFKNAVGQPTVMMRRDIIVHNKLAYNPDFENGEDFDFWYNAAIKGIAIKNIKNVLIYYRQSESQLSHPSNTGIRIETLKIYFRNKLMMLGIELREDDFNLVHNFIRGRVKGSEQYYYLVDNTLTDILKANRLKNIFENVSLKAVVFAHRLRLIKYTYLEYGKVSDFAAKLFKLLYETGIRALWKFWMNEGRFGRNFGASKIYKSVLVLPGKSKR